MKVETLFPYAKRLQRKRTEELVAYVIGHKPKALIDIILNSGLFVSASGHAFIDGDADFVFVDYNNIKPDTVTPKLWDYLKNDGWIVFPMNDHNWPLIKQFRKDLKISSTVCIADGMVFFQKEDYSKRTVSAVQQIENFQKSIEPTRGSFPIPDPAGSHLKPYYLAKYAQPFAFVETGTYLGQTVELVRKEPIPFQQIHSIEIDYRLASNAKQYFDFDPRIVIHLGDSVDKVQEICQNLTKPSTFWLDAHASGPLKGGKTGPCPLIEELEAIHQTGIKDHTIFIDDRRLFGSAEWGFLQEEKVMEMLKKINPEYKILYLDGEVPEDIICATVIENDISVKEPVSPSVSEIVNSSEIVLEDME